MADLAVSVAPATAPAERAAMMAFVTISGAMGRLQLPQTTGDGVEISGMQERGFEVRPGFDHPAVAGQGRCSYK
jgi:hypothetical protein